VEIERYDPYMRREFTRVRYNLFKQLYDINFSISDIAILTKIFQSNFQDIVKFLETQNNRHIGMGGVYINNTQSYSFDSFRFLLLGCVDNVYPEIVSDLQTLYLNAMPANRMINPGLYQTSALNYKPI
jgi:ribosome biogenesis GTPase A